MGADVDTIEAWLREGDPGQYAVIDLSETRLFDVAALGQLAEVVSHTEQRVDLRGLSEHHCGLLRDLGRALRADEARSTSTNCLQ